jgi:hypothetical protein
MYRSAAQWQQALRIAEAYLPNQVVALNREMAQHMQVSVCRGGLGTLFVQQGRVEGEGC